VLQMGRPAHWPGPGDLQQLQGSALVPHEGPHTPGAVPRGSSGHAVQPILRGEVPRILGEHAHHARAFPTAPPLPGLCNTPLAALQHSYLIMEENLHVKHRTLSTPTSYPKRSVFVTFSVPSNTRGVPKIEMPHHVLPNSLFTHWAFT
jgi:hypothetical protein